ncbi:MAG: glycosyltransferase [Propioniciclava sp.]
MFQPDSSPAHAAPRVGYVLKMYPRFSETFILTEMLALQATGTELAVFSQRLPIDGRFHAALASLRAPVTYLPHRFRPVELWHRLSHHQQALDLTPHLAELLTLGVDEALAAVEVAATARQQGLRHLHAHFGSTAASVARMAARIAGIGYSFTAHAKDIFHDSVDPAQLAIKLRDARFVVTVSDYNLEHLRTTYGPDAARVRRLYNGLDLAQFRYRPHGRARRIAAVGRLVEKKGFDDLLRALALLRQEGHAVPLDLVGHGPEAEPLRALATQLGVTDLVTFHGGLPQHQVADLVRHAAVFAAPCVVGADGNRDGLPTVLLEAQAVGTPVVSTPVTGIPEAVIDGETGLLVGERDATALADALRTLLTNQPLANQLAARARRHIETTFDIDQNAQTLRTWFSEAEPVAAAGSGPARRTLTAHTPAQTTPVTTTPMVVSR